MAGQENLAEEITQTVLGKLQKEKLIAKFIRSQRNEDLDIGGIDFLIILNSGYAIPLQVKTDNKNIEKKLDEHKNKHSEIKFVLCVPTHRFRRDPEKIYKVVEAELRQYLKSAPN